MNTTAHSEHRAFLNTYYGISRHFYDLTRKYYLFGRDTCLDGLLESEWKSLIEIGSGTGRNLRALHKRRAGARYGGVDASDAMLEHARQKCGWASFAHGFAETADLVSVLGERPERILFSYTLSMVQGQREAIDNARRALAENGELVIVDFCDAGGFPAVFQRALKKWLNAFHVHPLDSVGLFSGAKRITYGPGRYYVIVTFGPLAG